MPRPIILSLVLAPLSVLVPGCSGADAEAGLQAADRGGPGGPHTSAVDIRIGEGRVEIGLDGDPFTVLRWKDLPQPVFLPVLGPDGVRLTRNWPVVLGDEANRGEATDHPHHRGLWFNHGAVGGHDFWTQRGCRIDVVEARLDDGVLVTRQEWRTAAGELVCRDVRRYGFGAHKGARWIDVDVTVQALPDRPLRFGDTKEGSFGMRLHPALRPAGDVATGAILTSEGRTADDAWGTRARWVDYRGTVEGRAAGVALFDHPDNLRHPTWWHARKYGLVAANPFGRHDFTGAGEGAGDHEVPADGSQRFRYRVWCHDGGPDADALDAAWRAWSGAERADPADGGR